MKLPLCASLLVSIAACAHPQAALAPDPYLVAIDEKLIRAAAEMRDADDRYLTGRDPEDSEDGRRAFRSACLEHQVDREMRLDQMHAYAARHVVLWKMWYEDYCTPVAMPPGQAIAWSETGQEVAAGVYFCPQDRGAAPPRAYERTEDEKLAQAQRDACERAQ